MIVIIIIIKETNIQLNIKNTVTHEFKKSIFTLFVFIVTYLLFIVDIAHIIHLIKNKLNQLTIEKNN